MHTCPRCHYSTDHRGHYIEHLNKLNTCKPEFSNISIEEILRSIEIVYNRRFTCDSCNRSFTKKCSLNRHRENNCPNIALNANNNTTSQSHNTTQNTNTHSHNTTNNTTNTTTQSHNTTNTTTNSHNQNINIETLNVVQLRLFGDEFTSHVENDHEFMTKCLKDVLSQGIPDLVNKIYFNPAVPENRNAKLEREHKPSRVMVFTQEGDENPQWKPKDLNEVVSKMIDKGCTLLVKHNNTLFCVDAQGDFARQLSTDEKELYDFRSDRISSIKNKKRGLYGSIKNNVIIKAKEAKERESTTA